MERKKKIRKGKGKNIVKKRRKRIKKEKIKQEKRLKK